MSITAKKSNSQKIPKLRFPGFEGEWEEKRLGEVFHEIKSGKDKPQRDGRYLVYGSTGVIGSINDFTYEGVHILIARVGANAGKLNRVSGQFGVTDNTLVLENSDFSDVNFFYHLLESKKLNRLVFGSGQPLVTSGHLKKLEIVVPEKGEQQKIAGFFTSIDQWVDTLRAQKETLESYKKGLMQKIFAQEIRFKDDNGKEFPKWEEKKLGEVFDFLPTNSLSRSQLNYETGIVKNIHYGDIHTKFRLGFDIREEDLPYIDVDIDVSKVKPEAYCQEGDLVIADASEDYKDIGKTIELLYLKGAKILAGLHTLLLRPQKKLSLAKGFSGYLMRASFIRAQIMEISTGISVLGISKGNLSKIDLVLPSHSEQQKIAAFLTSIDKLIEAKQKQIALAEQWKKGLMRNLFV